MNLQATAHPLLASQAFFEVAFLPWEEKLAALRDPVFRQRVIQDAPLDLGEFPNMITRSFHKMFLMNEGAEYEPKPEDSVAARAQRQGVSPRQIAYDALMERDGKGMLYFPLFNYSGGSLEVLRKLHMHPSTRMGLSDAGAHCGAVCDGGMPTFMLTHWTRDRTRGEKMPLERVVQRQTRETAEFYGLMDRGLVAPGMRADLNVINFEGLGFTRPEVVFDLPAGGRRLIQKARGYVATVCAGVVTVEQDTFTGALPGRLIRGPQHA